MNFPRDEITKLILAIVLCQMAGVVGSFFTAPSIDGWYSELNKPWFVPPGWLFAPAWITLYTLMGISLYLVTKKGWNKKEVRDSVGAFAVQLVLNAIWSIIFFGLKSPFYAFLEIIVLWLAIVYTIIKFYKISKPAAIILIPYMIWVTFAAFLNYYVWVLN